MRKPTPVTMSIITPESASTLKRTSMGMLAAGAGGRVHPAPGRPGEVDVLVVLLVDDDDASAAKVTTEATKLPPTARSAMSAHGALAEAAAPDAVHEGAEQGERQDDGNQRKVRRGEQAQHRGSRRVVSREVNGSVLEEVGVVGTNGALEAEERKHDGEADRDLGGLGGDDEEGEDSWPAWLGRPARG